MTFAPAPGSPFRAGSQPSAVAVADFNADGKPDLVVANSGADHVTVLYGDGQGRFRTSPPFAAMNQPHMLVTADFNSDKRPDVAVSSHDSNQVALLLNDGKGSLRRASTFDAFADQRVHNHGLAAGDLNDDGNIDITVSHQDLDRIAILLGNGQGQFRATAEVPVGRSPYPHTLADVNRDGALDIVVPNVRGGDVRVLRGNGRGAFVLQSPPLDTGIERPYFVAVRDLNGDRAPDLVVTHDDTSRISVILNDGKGGFRSPASLDFRNRSGQMDIADIDGDGKPDIALAGGRLIQVVRGDGRGGFSGPLNLTIDGDTWRVVIVDLNGDRRPDIVAPANDTVHVFLAQ